MNLKSCRTLLQYSTQPEILHSSLQPMNTNNNNDSNSITTAIGRPFKLTSVPFDSSMALTILVLLTALLFMGFFSIYIRHFTSDTITSASHDHTRRNSSSSSCQKGLDKSTVQSLPLIPYGGAAKHLIEDCPICLTEFEVSELVRVIPYCCHVFHQHCLDTWLSSHVTCPLCRSTQFFKKVDGVCLEVGNENGVSESSTVLECDTCRNLRRSCSSSNLGSRVALHRSLSF
ncbi:unnamed protein product [Withania somnifera]